MENDFTLPLLAKSKKVLNLEIGKFAAALTLTSQPLLVAPVVTSLLAITTCYKLLNQPW